LNLSVDAAQYIRDEVIPPGITRDNEINPTGTANAICLSSTPGPTFNIAFCSTVDLTAKTVLYKIPEYTVSALPSSHPLAIVTDAANASTCTSGGGSTKNVCWWNGSAWVSLSGGGGGGGGLPDPGSNGIVVRTALSTVIARQIGAVSGQITVTNPTGVAGNPTIGTGAQVPLLNQANTWTAGQQIFNTALAVPRKATPGDLSTLANGEVYVDGELLKFKSNTGVLYTLFRIGDPVVRVFSRSVAPIITDDSTQGYVVGDIWVNTTTNKFCIATKTTAGAAVWDCPTASQSQTLAQVLQNGNRANVVSCGTGLQIGSNNGIDFACLYWNNSKGFAVICQPLECLVFRAVWIDAGTTETLGDCTVAAAEIPSGGYKRRYGTCADTTGDEFHFGWTFDKGWNGGTVRALAIALNTNATPSGTFTLAINGHCTPKGSAPSTLSTSNSQNASITTWTAQNSEEHALTSPITLLGTCTNAPTDPTSVDFRARVTAAPAQIADIRVKGFLLLYADVSISH
jgi:hypothetical protein